jgi:hypothetical protein
MSSYWSSDAQGRRQGCCSYAAAIFWGFRTHYGFASQKVQFTHYLS